MEWLNKYEKYIRNYCVNDEEVRVTKQYAKDVVERVKMKSLKIGEVIERVFDELSEANKMEEIDSWITVMDDILNEVEENAGSNHS